MSRTSLIKPISGNNQYKFGAVYTRSVVLDPTTNRPIWVEYDANGREAGVLGGMEEGDFTFSGEEYRTYNQQFQQLQAQGAEYLPIAEYLSQSEYLTADGQAFPRVDIKPNYDDVQFVQIRPQDQTQLANGEHHLLARYPVDVQLPAPVDAACTVRIAKFKRSQAIYTSHHSGISIHVDQAILPYRQDCCSQPSDEAFLYPTMSAPGSHYNNTEIDQAFSPSLGH